MKGDKVLRSELLALLQGGGEIAIMRQVMNVWPAENRYLTGRPD